MYQNREEHRGLGLHPALLCAKRCMKDPSHYIFPLRTDCPRNVEDSPFQPPMRQGLEVEDEEEEEDQVEEVESSCDDGSGQEEVGGSFLSKVAVVSSMVEAE